jgi:DNA gyrase inhibitor GyrI
MSQDDPDITPPTQCRYDLCVVAPPDFNGDGDISARTLPAGQMAVLGCTGDIIKVDRAWQYLYRFWLPRSRYLPADLPAMEIYRRLPDEIGWETFDLDCGVPILNSGFAQDVEEHDHGSGHIFDQSGG